MKIPMIIKNKKRNPTKRSRGNPSIKPTTMMIAKATVTISKLRKRRETTAVKNEDRNMRSITPQRKKKSIMMTVIRNMEMTAIRNMETSK